MTTARLVRHPRRLDRIGVVRVLESQALALARAAGLQGAGGREVSAEATLRYARTARPATAGAQVSEGSARVEACARRARLIRKRAVVELVAQLVVVVRHVEPARLHLSGVGHGTHYHQAHRHDKIPDSVKLQAEPPASSELSARARACAHTRLPRPAPAGLRRHDVLPPIHGFGEPRVVRVREAKPVDEPLAVVQLKKGRTRGRSVAGRGERMEGSRKAAGSEEGGSACLCKRAEEGTHRHGAVEVISRLREASPEDMRHVRVRCAG